MSAVEGSADSALFSGGSFQTVADMSGPISGQYLGLIGLVGAFELLDLLGTPLDSSFAIFRSNRIRVDQLLSEARLKEN